MDFSWVGSSKEIAHGNYCLLSNKIVRIFADFNISELKSSKIRIVHEIPYNTVFNDLGTHF